MLHLKDLGCTKIVQNGSILWALLSNDFGAEASENEQGRGRTCSTVGRLEHPEDASGMQTAHLNVERLRGGNDRRKPERESRGPGWSAGFKEDGSTRVNACQG